MASIGRNRKEYVVIMEHSKGAKMLIGDKYLARVDRACGRPVKAKCMNCKAETTITDKDQPCPVCALCGSLAWMDYELVN